MDKKKKLLVGLVSLAVLVVGALIIWANSFYFKSNIHDIQVEYGSQVEIEQPEVEICGRMMMQDGKKLKVYSKGTYDESVVGEYKVTYKSSYLMFHYKKVQKITIEDKEVPVIELIANEGKYTKPGEAYVEEGYRATDNYDGDLTGAVTSEERDGKVYYSVTDSSGNVGTAERTIVYKDDVPPELVLSGEETIALNAGAEYVEPGYKSTDNNDGDITGSVVVDNPVNIYKSGNYTVTYTSTDSYGNHATATRNVIINPIQNSFTTENPTGKTIYLTFDDGPSQYTEELLGVLAKYNVKATFFVVNGKYNNMIAREYQAGHSVGVHSFTHNYELIYQNEAAYIEDFNQMQNVIKEQTGSETKIFRFPGGSSNTASEKYCNRIMSKLAFDFNQKGYQYFDWNVSSGDAGETTDTEQVFQNVINGISGKNVAVVLQHDIKGFSVAAVEKIIIWGLNNGYTFAPASLTTPPVHHGINN